MGGKLVVTRDESPIAVEELERNGSDFGERVEFNESCVGARAGDADSTGSNGRRFRGFDDNECRPVAWPRTSVSSIHRFERLAFAARRASVCRNEPT